MNSFTAPKEMAMLYLEKPVDEARIEELFHLQTHIIMNNFILFRRYL